MSENEKLDRDSVPVRSEVVQEIMNKVPHLLIRWGNTLILILTMGILTISYLIRYPNIVHAQVELTNINPTSEVYTFTEGKLAAIMVKSGEEVHKETLLANIITSEGTQELRAQTSGTIYTVSFLTEGNRVDAGELLFKIIPLDSHTYQGVMRLPYEALSRVSQGQEVRIRLSDKATEQKVITGSVAKISQVADKQGLVAIQILLENGLITTTGQEFVYIPGMQGRAEVVVENPRLIEHFFYQLRNMFK